MRIGSLFAGIGGFDLAAEWTGWETAWYAEIDPYASAVMAKHYPHATNHGDIRTIDGRAVEHVELLCGGFPCQDISLAGKGAGLSGERSGLWQHYARLIEEIRPRWVVIENVSALRSRGLDNVLGALAALGYDAEWHCIPAVYVGAPHRRDRIWIVAWRTDADEPGSQGWLGAFVRKCASERTARAVGASVADAYAQQRREQQRARTRNESRRGGWWLTEPNVGRVAHGVPARVDRLRCLGNAIVPQVAYLIFQAIEAVEVAKRESAREAA